MNLDQLLESLGDNDPNPFHVMTQFERKRRTSRNRLYAASGGLAVVAAAIAAIALLPAIKLGSPTASSSSAASAAGAGSAARVPRADGQSGSGTASGAASSPGSATSCAAVPLGQAITTALRQGASVIVGYGTPTGTSVAGNPANGGAPAYYAVTLRSVRTLAGPKVASGSTAWIPGTISGTGSGGTGSGGTGSGGTGSGGTGSGGTGSSGTGSSGTAVAPEGEALWAPDGELFAIVSPTAAGSPRGPVLRSAPVINGQVIFSSYGCWDVKGLPASRYVGGAQVFEPVRVNNGGLQPAAFPGEPQYAVPLAAVEKIASGK